MPLFGKKPLTPRAVSQPTLKPKGIFGEKKYRSFSELREFARKAPFESAPGYGRKFTRNERVKLIETLQKYSGQSYGLSEEKMNLVLKKMQKEKMETKDFQKKKELDQSIKMLEKWRKGY